MKFWNEDTDVSGCLSGVNTIDSSVKNQGLGKNYGNAFVYQGEYKDDEKSNGSIMWLKQDGTFVEFEYINGKKQDLPMRMGV